MKPFHTWLAPMALACAGLFAASCSDEADPTPVDDEDPSDPTPITTDHELRLSMRAAWTDHTSWTRYFLIAAIADLDDAPQATARLLRNQDDIGAAIAPLYGEEAGAQLSSLLRLHITVAADMVGAARSGDEQRFLDAHDEWHGNASDIADFLAAANPHIDRAAVGSMLDMHLEQTLTEASARLEGRWADDVASYDVIIDHMEGMADTLAVAIATHLPDEVAVEEDLTQEEQELQVAMRSLWMDHVTWTRAYLISAIAGLEDVDAAAERLLRNQDDIGAAVATYYGPEAGAALTVLLREHITIAGEVVAEAATGEQPTIGSETALDRWRRNGDAIADFLADANPAWDREELRMMMQMHLDVTLAEAAARLSGEWDADIVAYDDVAAHILMLADALATGIAQQFPEKVGR